MANKWPGFAPHTDYSDKSQSKDVSQTKGKSRDKGMDGNKGGSEHEDSGYDKEDGYTGSKVTIHQHEDGSYHTQSVGEDGKEVKKEHGSYAEATKHAAKHFNEPHEMEGEYEGEEEGHGDEPADNYKSRKGGLGDSIKSLMS